VLTGDFKSISLVSLLQMIEADRKTGVLTVSTLQFQKKIFLKNGLLNFVVSEDPRDFLGHFLVSKGVISEDDLVKAFAIHKQSQQLIGRVLGKMAEISEEAMKAKIAEKIKDSVYQLFFEDLTKFSFSEEEVDFEKFPVSVEFPIQNLLMEGLKRFDEGKKLKEVFDHSDQTFKVVNEKLAEVPQKGSIPKIIELLEKGMSVNDICLHFHAYEYGILKYLDVLWKKGAIEKAQIKKKAVAAPASSAPKAAAAAVIAKVSDPVQDLLALLPAIETKGDFQKAMEVCRDIQKIEPGNAKADEHFKANQEKFVKKVIEESPPKTTVLTMAEKADFGAASLTPSDGFVLSRINGQWTLSEILSVVPLPEIEVLVSVRRLIDLGLVRTSAAK